MEVLLMSTNPSVVDIVSYEYHSLVHTPAPGNHGSIERTISNVLTLSIVSTSASHP